MATSERVGWNVCERCTEDGGIGARLPNSSTCWAHADEQDLETALKGLRAGRELDARGVMISTDLLKRLLATVPQDDGRPILREPKLERATFTGEARFDRATFQGPVGFGGATFNGSAGFRWVTFEGSAGFDAATFEDNAWFGEATFKGNARFDGATFEGPRQLLHMLVRHDLVFDNATFKLRLQLQASAQTLFAKERGSQPGRSSACAEPASSSTTPTSPPRRFWPAQPHSPLHLGSMMSATWSPRG